MPATVAALAAKQDIMRMRTSLLVFLTATLYAAPPARACNVPLFRFALERWRPDAYQFIVLHHGPLQPFAKTAVDELNKCVDQPSGGPNLTVDLLDVSKISQEDREKLKTLNPLWQLPYLVVRYPGGAGDGTPVWQGPLMDAPVRALLDSPVRREIAQRLLAGESGVWVLLESGDAKADAKAESELTAYLKNLEATRKLPELTDSPKDKLLREDLPLRIAFSIVRIRRDDPDEEMTVRLLLHSEPDLAARKEPMAFPMFGRGIMLYALVGKGINEDTVGDAVDLLVGACRCEVKKLNPGLDLLMTADWETGGPAAALPASFTALRCGTPDPPPRLFRNLLAVGGIGIGVVIVATILLLLRLRRPA